jgi:glycosyltransferase involved in cell wall biosynthesis
VTTDITWACAVIPAHNEHALIGASLDAMALATAHPDLAGMSIDVVVVTDSCTDATAARCQAQGVATLDVRERNVGRARAAGFEALLAEAPKGGESGGWLATTDADSRVASDWLAAQIHLARHGADATFGVIDVEDWTGCPPMTPDRFAAGYAGTAPDQPGPHPHVHGATMGLRADAYLRIGGMPTLAVGEDHELARRLTALGDLRVVRTTAVRVTTSARLVSRVHGGFADYLQALTDQPVP